MRRVARNDGYGCLKGKNPASKFSSRGLPVRTYGHLVQNDFTRPLPTPKGHCKLFCNAHLSTMDMHEIYRHIVANHYGKLLVETYKAPEVEVVQMLANGYTPQEIGEHLGRSEATVYRQLRTMRDAMHAASDAHLVALAIAHGMIEAEPLADDSEA